MDTFFTSLNKRQTMLLLTAVTFGGQESLSALEHLPEEEGDLLRHRAQELLQVPREKRLPALVQEIKRLVKDRRGQLWSADPERVAALLQRERGALAEVVLRALPGSVAEAVRSHLPPSRVKLTREVRPQVLDIVRWKLEEVLARQAGGAAAAGFKFVDVLLLQTRELLTVCDRLGARVLGPALAGLPEGERDGSIEQLPPDLRVLATKSVAANAPRKLPEEESRAQLDAHGGVASLAGAIRSAGVQRLARACVAQNPEFAARMLEKHRGEFGQLLARWVREERSRPTARGDGGRTDIVMDLERLVARGLIERPVRLMVPPPRPMAVLPPPPGARKPAAGAPPRAEVSRAEAPSAAPARPAAGAPGEAERGANPAARGPGGALRAPAGALRGPAGALRPPSAQRGVGARSETASSAEGEPRRDFMAERAARRAGAASFRPGGRPEGGADESRPRPSAERGSAVSAMPRPEGEGAADGSRVRRPLPPERGSAVSSMPRQDDADGSRVRRPPPDRGSAVSAMPRPEGEGAADGSRVRRPLPLERGSAISAMPRPESEGAADGSRVRRPPPADKGSSIGPPPRREIPAREGRAARPDPDGARIGPPPSRLGAARGAPPSREEGTASRVGRPGRPGAAEPDAGSRVQRRPDAPAPEGDPDGSRVFRSRSGSRPVARPAEEPERPPRVVAGRSATSASMAALRPGHEGTAVGRRRGSSGVERQGPPPPGGRGPRGGTR
ncbi:hypothetical protein KRR26_05280 [Corallococcus sp. M34]|uniref:hypothetical protein n=1 Tax=Citreicoccus inhibens TaxID=2849499 RepID=UPI001C219FC1|nr:hypothetical protein [Citreicoccus inhibens]MBU8895003.1 hypothetical protein [Citreicoccus inhibens]